MALLKLTLKYSLFIKHVTFSSVFNYIIFDIYYGIGISNNFRYFQLPFFYSIDVDMKSTLYCHAIQNGAEDEWDFAWERYKNSNVATEKRALLGGLSCTKEIWLLNR